jgi:hypothetical protein
MDRQMFKKGGPVYMQQGGMAPMPAPAPAGPGPEVMAGAMGQIDPNAIDINQAAQGAMQQGIDPAMLEGMLGQYANQMEDLENAQDYEQVINGIRGDTAPIEQRYTELAGIVGQEDAQQTPESVLALVQPVMLMASVDQGIGGLAMEEMNAPVEGAMAEGIMSTVNMGAQEPTQGLGGPAPVNFNQGGAVQYMQTGGVPVPQGLQDRFDYQRSLYGQILGQDSFDEDLSAQEELTKAQMLFDIAQGGLAFAAGSGQPGATPAQDLAAAFIQPLGNIGARAGELGKYKDALKRERRSLDLSALQTAQQGYEAEEAAARAAAAKDIEEIFFVTVVGEDGNPTVVHDGPLTRGDYAKLIETHGADKLTVTEKSTKAPAAAAFTNFVNPQTGVTVSLDVSTPLGRQQATVATQQLGFIEGGTYSVNPSGMFGTGREGSIMNMLANDVSLQAYKDGTLDPASTLGLNVAIGNYVAPSTAYNPATGVNERIPGKSLPTEWMDAIAARQSANLSVPNLRIGTSEPPVPTDAQLPPTATPQAATPQAATPQETAATDTAIEIRPVGEDTGEVISPENTETTATPATNEAFNAANSKVRQFRFNEDGTVNYEAFKSDPTFTITGVDLTEGLGWRSGFRNFLNKGAAALAEVNIGTGYAGERGRITSAARAELDSLGRQTMQDARGGVEGRVFATDLNMLQNSIDAFQPGTGNDMSALSKLRATRNEVASMYAGAAKILREPSNYSQQQVQAARPLFDNLQVLLGEYTAAITIFEESLAGRGIPIQTEAGEQAQDNASRLLQGINTYNQQRGSQ